MKTIIKIVILAVLVGFVIFAISAYKPKTQSDNQLNTTSIASTTVNSNSGNSTSPASTTASSTVSSNSNKPPIVEHFACSDLCPGPREQYMVRIYQGVTDENKCKELGGVFYTYVGWGTFKICKVK